MRKLGFDTTAFIAEYKQAAEAGLTLREVADLMGISYSQICQRKHALNKRGIRLPRLPNGNLKRAAKPILRLARPVECVVEPVPMTFTIEVGVGHA
jgi:hypothetical protein